MARASVSNQGRSVSSGSLGTYTFVIRSTLRRSLHNPRDASGVAATTSVTCSVLSDPVLVQPPRISYSAKPFGPVSPS